MDIEALHSQFFNVVARVIPGVEDLHYGLGAGPPKSPFGMLGRLKQGSRRLLASLDEAAGMARWPAGARGLDVGCGLGGTIRYLRERRGFRMVGLNLNQRQLGMAAAASRRKGFTNDVSFVGGDARALPLADGSFDFVVLIEVAFHVQEKARLFRELARVLRPGGRVVLVDQEFRRPAEVMGLFFFVGFGGYRELARQAGLRVAGERDLTRQVAWWMEDYIRAASWPFHGAALLLALFRGGPRLARGYASGVRAFNRLIVEDLSRDGGRRVRSPFPNGLRALREHTRRELLEGRSAYKVFVFEKSA